MKKPPPPIIDSLPADPTPDQVRQILSGEIMFIPRSAPPPALRHIGTYFTLKEAWGVPMSGPALGRFVGQFDWRGTYSNLADLAAIIANHGESSEQAARATLDPLRQLRSSVDPREARIADLVGEHPRRVIAHEEVLYFVQSLAILEGNETGPVPGPAAIAFMLLAANDHLPVWLQPDDPPVSQLEGNVADFCRLSRFNRHSDGLRNVGRAAMLFDRLPRRGPLRDKQVWESMQALAFGRSLYEHLNTFIVPLLLEAERWASEDDNGNFVRPVAVMDRWFAETRVPAEQGAAFLRSLTWTRDEAKVELLRRVRDDGLPHAPTLFVKKPFVEIEPGVLVAASPRAVREQLRGGLWINLARTCDGAFGRETWSRAFGVEFESACKELAEEAARDARFRGTLLLAPFPGHHDEIEDVVIADAPAVALFSAKSTVVREDKVRQAISRRALIDWYEEFFFRHPRGGVLRQLDAKVAAIRSGAVPSLRPDSKVLPVVLTFDDFGENLALYAWLDARCREEGLLQGERIAPVTVLTLEDYEGLLALGSRGYGVCSLLDRKVSSEWRKARMDSLLKETARERRDLRLESLMSRFDELVGACTKRLFGKSLGRRPSDG